MKSMNISCPNCGANNVVNRVGDTFTCVTCSSRWQVCSNDLTPERKAVLKAERKLIAKKEESWFNFLLFTCQMLALLCFLGGVYLIIHFSAHPPVSSQKELSTGSTTDRHVKESAGNRPKKPSSRVQGGYKRGDPRFAVAIFVVLGSIFFLTFGYTSARKYSRRFSGYQAIYDYLDKDYRVVEYTMESGSPKLRGKGPPTNEIRR